MNAGNVDVASVMFHINVKLQLLTTLANWTGLLVLNGIDHLAMFYNPTCGTEDDAASKLTLKSYEDNFFDTE